MIIVVFLLILPVISLLSLLYFIKTRESIKWDIYWGRRCWYCKENLEPWQYFFGDPNIKEKYNKLKCCDVCTRHIKITKIQSRFKSFLIDTLKFIISEKYYNFIWTLVIINLILLVVYLIWIIFIGKYVLLAVLIFFIFNGLFWIASLLGHYLTSMKKQKPSK